MVLFKSNVFLTFPAKVKAKSPPPRATHSPPPPPRPAPTIVVGEDRTEALKGIKKAMAKSMAAALSIPHFGYCDEIDLTNLVGLRAQLKVVIALRLDTYRFIYTFITIILYHISLLVA